MTDDGPAPSGSADGVAASAPRRRRGVLLLIAAGGLVVAVLAALVVAGVIGGDPAKARAKAAREAGRNLKTMAGVSLSGSYGGSHATFTVTSAGTARGAYTSGGAPVSRLDVGGRTYLQAGARFWTAHGQSSDIARTAQGRWTQAPYSTTTELGLAGLAPAQLGQNLLDPGTSPASGGASVNGVHAIRLSAAGMTYFVSASAPHRVLRVEGRTVGSTFSFDVTPLRTRDMGTFYTALRNAVRELKDAYNPDVIFLPVDGEPHVRDCDASGCTAGGEIEADASGGSGTVHVLATVLFTGPGTVCVDSLTATSKVAVRYSCRVAGRGWTSWYRSHAGRSAVRTVPFFQATVNSAQDVSHLLLMLTQEQQQTS